MNVVHRSHSRFVEYFPPPRFLEMASVGLDLSDRNIRFIELLRKGQVFELGKYGAQKMPDGAIQDGEIKDKAKLIEALSAIQKQNNLHFIKASLPEEKSYLFKTEIPVMAEEEIRDALKFKIEENVPVALEDAVFDYSIIKQPEAGEKNMVVSVTVINMKVASSYIEVFKSAHLVPIEFHIESQAVAHAAIPNDSTGTHILVALRGGRTVIAIVSEGVVQFTSTIHIGGNSIALALERNLNINESEVEKIRQGKEVRDSNEMFYSLINAASALRDEVKKVMAYWDNHSQEHGHSRLIESITISGSDSLLGLDNYLSRSLDMKVAIANPWSNILTIHDYIPAITLREALDYMPALGLALPYD